MDREHAEATVARFLSLLEQGDIDAWVELFAEDAAIRYPYHSGVLAPATVGREAIRAEWEPIPRWFVSAAVVGAIEVRRP